MSTSAVRSVLPVALSGLLFAGCAGGMAQPPGISSLPATPGALKEQRLRSWMAPNVAKSDLLYAADDSGIPAVWVFRYPDGRLVGKLTAFTSPSAVCVDDKSKEVFVTDFYAQAVYVYAHGGSSPIRTLSSPGYYPLDCWADPTTHNLAVGEYVPGSFADVGVYLGAIGYANQYPMSQLAYVNGVTYDRYSNLYANGSNSSEQVFLFELCSGCPYWRQLQLNQPMSAMQFSQGFLTVLDISNNIDRFLVTESGEVLVGSTPLSTNVATTDYFILNSTVVTVDNVLNAVLFYNYPAGGTAYKALSNFGASFLVGVAISRGKR